MLQTTCVLTISTKRLTGTTSGRSFLRYWIGNLGYCTKEAVIVLCYFVIFETGFRDKGSLWSIARSKVRERRYL